MYDLCCVVMGVNFDVEGDGNEGGAKLEAPPKSKSKCEYWFRWTLAVGR